MCGRYVSTTSSEELVAEYRVDEVCLGAPLPPRWNVAPTQPVYVVTAKRDPQRRRQLGTMRWGLVPSWAQSPAVGPPMINARAETVATKPAFRTALRRRRCIIPADSFWEWQAGTGRSKQPYAIRRQGGGTLAFAGLWAVWRDPASPGRVLQSAAIVTTDANRALAQVHPRMPVVLDEAAVAVWLDPEVEDPDLLLGLLESSPDDRWEAWPVGSAVNAVGNDGPGLLERVEPPVRVQSPDALFALPGG